MRYKLWVQILLISLIITIGIIVIISGQRLNVPSRLSVDGFNVQAYEYSISLNHDRNPSIYYKVSPYDDALVLADETNSTRIEKLAFANEDITNIYIKRASQWRLDTIWYRIRSIAGTPIVRYASDQRNYVEYDAQSTNNEIIITKTIQNMSDKASGYVNTLGFTSEDIVFDSNGIVYTQLTNVDLLKKLGLKSDPQIAENLRTLSGIRYIAIYNESSKRALLMDVINTNVVTIDRQYNLIGSLETFEYPIQKELNVNQHIKILTLEQLAIY
ncbi:hypothetical protein HGA91_02995 [candidate division WWE3 bacterium]|nr:hypothetical protein [candidate division WWE3 bacterium]